jgi:hypothetical protein
MAQQQQKDPKVTPAPLKPSFTPPGKPNLPTFKKPSFNVPKFNTSFRTQNRGGGGK